MKNRLKNKKGGSGGILRLFKLASKAQWYFVSAVILMIIKMGITIVFITFIARILEYFYLTSDFSSLFSVFTYEFVFFLFTPLIQIYLTIFIRKLTFFASSHIRTHLRHALFKQLLELEIGYIENSSTAAIVNNTVEGIEALETFYSDFLPQLFYSMLMPLILFVYFLSVNVAVGIILVLGFPLIPASIMVVQIRGKSLMKSYWDNYSDVGAKFLDNLQGLNTLKETGMDEIRENELSQEFWKFRNITMKVLKMQLKSILYMDSIAYGLAGIAIVVGITQFNIINIAESHVISNLIIIILLSVEFFLPLRKLGGYFHAGMNGITASHGIFEILDASPNLKINPNQTQFDRTLQLKANIQFKNVSFSFKNRNNSTENKQILRNINFQIEHGKNVALIGDSGSGKSIIANLIARFYDIDNGVIELDGYDISKIPLDYLRKQISYVGANTYIFTGSIKDNLKIVNPNLSDDKMKNACDLAGIKKLIELKGLDYDVGEWGNKLSGGEKQRLGIARAILHSPLLYIFDEATSNIDVESEEKIWESINTIAKGKTTLIISHRLVNIQKAQKILVLKDGQIVEKGNHVELMNLDGYYKKGIQEQELYEKY